MKPKISFVTPMKEKDFRVIKLLDSIKSQNYPKNKIEVIITDGGSNPDVLKKCKEYSFVKIYHNPKGFAEGAGMGKDQGIWKSTGEFVVIAESDIELIGNEWINNMLKPLEKDKEIFASVPRLYVNPADNFTNRYLSYVGVDPFAVQRSIEGQLELNQRLIKRKENYFIEILNKDKPYCMGSNGFMFRKSLIKKVGDYAQDVEFIARLAKADIVKFAVVNNARIWHKNVKGLYDFLKKRVKWTRNYTTIYISEKKDFNWITDKKEFVINVASNLLVFPNIPISIKKSVEYRDSSWLLHSPLMFLSTALNIYFSLTSKKMMKQILGI
ncbi:MAG: glycosyltransferase family 2 protein [Nanoarchaeota archaeon]|nr:glycosyltransferase family 2 protein [Nanoarchaeota archaeon]